MSTPSEFLAIEIPFPALRLDQIMKKQDRMIERRKKDNSFTDTYNGR